MDTTACGTALNVGTLWVSVLTLGSEGVAVGTAGKKGLFLGKGLSPHWEDGTLDSSRLAGDEREQFLLDVVYTKAWNYMPAACGNFCLTFNPLFATKVT